MRSFSNPLPGSISKHICLCISAVLFFIAAVASAAGRESAQVKVSAVAGTGTAPIIVTPAATSAPARPAAPTGLKAEPRGEGIRLSWNKMGPEVIGYNLYLTDDSGKPDRIVSTQIITDNWVNLKKVNPERLYWFYLTGVNKQGVQSGPSAVLEVRPADFSKTTAPAFSDPVLVIPGESTHAETKPAPKKKPAPPAKPKVEAPAPAPVKAEPSAPANTEEPTPTKTETPVPLIKAEPAPSGGSTKLTMSEQSPVTTIDKKWLTEGKVKKFTTRPGDGMVRLSWDTVPGAVGYHLYVSYDEKTFTLITRNGPQNILELNIRSLKNGTTYYFAITAVNEAGQESEKTMLPAVPKAAP